MNAALLAVAFLLVAVSVLVAAVYGRSEGYWRRQWNAARRQVTEALDEQFLS